MATARLITATRRATAHAPAVPPPLRFQDVERSSPAVVEKEAVVTGEVVIGKGRVREGQEVTDTVRRERVEVTDTGRRERDEE